MTVSGFLALCEKREVARAICRETGMSEDALETAVAEARRVVGTAGELLRAVEITDGMLGAYAEPGAGSRAYRKAVAYEGSRGRARVVTPRRVDLSDRLGPVRDQGDRGTCVAHAMVAVREFEERRLGRAPDLSPQHLYYLCKQSDGEPGPGTFPSTALEQLTEHGVCREKTWPYDPRQTHDEGQGPAPRAAGGEARRYRIIASGRSEATVANLKARFDGAQGAPKVHSFSAIVFSSLSSSEVFRTGDVVMPFEGEPERGRHHLVAVGYEDHPSAPGGGWVLFRNSWGTRWGRESAVGPGHGRLPYAYWSRYVDGFYTMERRESPVERPSPPHVARRPAVLAAAFLLLLWLTGAALVGWHGRPGPPGVAGGSSAAPVTAGASSTTDNMVQVVDSLLEVTGRPDSRRQRTGASLPEATGPLLGVLGALSDSNPDRLEQRER
jgi:hypothetical protein